MLCFVDHCVSFVRLVVVLFLYNLRLSFGHCIVYVLLTAFVCSLYCFCATDGFRLVIALSMYYLRLSFGHCIVSVPLTAFVWSLYCLCTTHIFCLVIVLSLYYLRLSLGHCIISVIWSRHCLDASTSFLSGQCVYI